jgi:hypothetical protein
MSKENNDSENILDEFIKDPKNWDEFIKVATLEAYLLVFIGLSPGPRSLMPFVYTIIQYISHQTKP